MAAGAGSGHRPFFLPARVLGRPQQVCVSIGGRCPRLPFCLRLALLPLVLLACRTRDNPEVCTTAKQGDCGPGPGLQPDHPAVRATGRPDVGRPGSSRRPGRGTTGTDGPASRQRLGRRRRLHDRRQLPGRQADLLARRPLRGLPGAMATARPTRTGRPAWTAPASPARRTLHAPARSRIPPPPSAPAPAPVSQCVTSRDCSQADRPHLRRGQVRPLHLRQPVPRAGR